MTSGLRIIFFTSIFMLIAPPSLRPQGQQERITNDFFGVDLMFSPIHATGFMARKGHSFTDIMKRSVPLIKEAGIGVVGFEILWEEIQVSEGCSYDWQALDKIMKIFHDNGMKAKILFYPASSWASKRGKTPVEHKNWRGPVGRQYLPDWCKAVKAVVERYDGDGTGDAFKMDYPVLWLLQLSAEVESPKHWEGLGGTYKEYDELLNLTVKCAKMASDSTIIGRGASNFGNIFETANKDKLLQIEDVQEKRHKSFLHFFVSSIQKEDDYDMFGLQFNYSWKGIIPEVEWVKRYLEKAGYMKALYCNHARSTEVGYTEELTILTNPGRADYQKTRNRYYAVQASTVAKKLTVSLASGIKYVGIACLFDLPGFLSESPISPHGASAAQWALTGILNTDSLISGDKHVAKPAYYSYKLFVDKILGASSEVKRLCVGKHVWAFQFMKGNKPIYVLWSDRYEGYRNGVATEVVLPVSFHKAQVTRIVTEWGAKTPQIEVVTVSGGSVRPRLTQMPIFLEEAK